ncbi:MAG: hypothetical protein KA040_02685 [Aliarcobacter sp.]|jgi:RNA recognition motif-containing protein|nr:hypothetical protein [Aliarcobacter sp.]
MIKKLILSVLFPSIIFASSLKINDKISNFSLTDQFDKMHTINSGISTIIVTFQKNTLEIINDFLSSKNENFLENNHAIFISNITSNPTIMTKMFTIPHLRDYKHTILLVHDENSIKFLKEENKATIYSISGGQVNNIQYISSKDELERFFK